MPGATRTAIGVTGNPGAIDPTHFEMLSGVAEAIRVSKPYKLVGRDLKHDDTIIQVGGVQIGGPGPAIIAGPCAVESYDQTMEIAELVASTGVTLFRGGAFKPRTSPYAFQGLGEEGLKILAAARERFGLRIVTEVLDTETADLVEDYADIVQIGARNMQNFSLLRRVGQANKPVMLKRGMSATLDELLLAAEYIMAEGNYNVILCERGVRTFADHTRNTLDLSIVPAVQARSHLPIIVDPSHGTGKRHKVIPLARAAIAAGADGIMVEVHNHPEQALSDGPQALLPDMFRQLVADVHAIHKVIAEADSSVL
jgi:3-deoxy-7-phosphoheptulonate synthase